LTDNKKGDSNNESTSTIISNNTVNSNGNDGILSPAVKRVEGKVKKTGGGTIRALKNILAPKVKLEEYEIKVAPFVEEGLFLYFQC
jgi:hypothetical protein